jgi:glyoxylase-like metal-dependent hydrolase (beta-lactamase superfamily II)
MQPDVTAFFDEATNTVSYVVVDPELKKCAVIDPVLDFDSASGRTATESADLIVNFIEQNSLELEWILETHLHADHLTAAPYIKEKLGGKICIGSHIKAIQEDFINLFNLSGVAADGSQFDRLIVDGDKLSLGKMHVSVIHTPGHTPACKTFVIGDAAFVGDTLFMPDFGTARCDFPGGDAAVLYQSIQKIFELPAATRLFMCHDYMAKGRDKYAWESSVAEQREKNVHIHDGVSKAEFVNFRNGRDTELEVPNLIIPAIQINIRCGGFPAAEDNGTSYLKIPLNQL